MFGGCSGVLWAVSGCSGGVSGMFRGVPEVFRGCSGDVLGCYGFYRHPFVSPKKWPGQISKARQTLLRT